MANSICSYASTTGNETVNIQTAHQIKADGSLGTNGVQPLPEKVAAIQALELPRDIKELLHFLGLVGFYRKFISFFTNVTACLNTML